MRSVAVLSILAAVSAGAAAAQQSFPAADAAAVVQIKPDAPTTAAAPAARTLSCDERRKTIQTGKPLTEDEMTQFMACVRDVKNGGVAPGIEAWVPEQDRSSPRELMMGPERVQS